ncbi:hypothetical protein B0H13DRAFT_2340583 [Mycena leptocephala]|nr:hypothetical protein B0H13DRAFT_2340583 [Mycena leptocephala]
MFVKLEKHLIPNIREELLRNGTAAPTLFGQHKGSKGAHSTDISSIKKAIPIWYPHWSPVYNSNTKHEMGFRHPNCGKWLCPADLDWEDEKIQQELRDGTNVPGPEDFNRGLFFNEDPDPEDLMSGFLKSDALVRAYTHIFISPTSALAEDGPDKSKGKGNAAEHNMTEATLESIYYVAHILHFCFSSQSTFQAKGGNGHFSYRNYFKWLQKTVSEWPASDQEDLLTWWNEKVFSQSVVQPKKRTDGSLSIAERMRAQAAAAKAVAEQSAILSRGSGATAVVSPDSDDLPIRSDSELLTHPNAICRTSSLRQPWGLKRVPASGAKTSSQPYFIGETGFDWITRMPLRLRAPLWTGSGIQDVFHKHIIDAPMHSPGLPLASLYLYLPS